MSRLQECVEKQTAMVDSQMLPDYDKGYSTRTFMLLGLVMSYSIGITSLIAGIYILSNLPSTLPTVLQRLPLNMLTVPAGFSGFVPLLPIYIKIIVLFFNLLVASLTECMGYIHTVTLRWAFASEGRLHFNSNLRLFSAAHNSLADGWLSNLASACLLIFCFAAASQILVPITTLDSTTPNNWITLNGIALIFLGVGLTGLAVITTIGMARAERTGLLLSWNPNAFNTTLACLHSGALTRRKDRSMRSAASTIDPFARPILPVQKQPSARETLFLTRYVMGFLWIIFLLTLVLAVSVCAMIYVKYSKNEFDHMSWFFIGDGSIQPDNAAAILVIPIPGDHTIVHLLGSFLWTILLASFSTIALHAAELIVNLRRDESDRRKAYTKKGASFTSGAFASATGNKGSIFLFTFKPFLQWVYGLSIFARLDPALEVCEIIVNPVAISVLLLLVLVLAIFVSACARISPRSCQPSTYGHLQTLADLIDDWSDGPVDKLFWGDKGVVLSKQDNSIVIRKAGTSYKKYKVADIIPTACYI